MMKLLNMLYILPSVLLVACGSGGSDDTATGTYYTGGYDYYYQVQSESGASTTTLNVLGSNGSTLFSAPLTSTGNNSYTFTSNYNNQTINGNVVITNGILSIAANVWGIDIGTNSANPIQNGSYSTICDKGNISPCTVNVNNNSISITEYSTSGAPTVLCSNSLLVETNSVPNNYTFKCGIMGSSTPQYSWYVTSFTRNGVPGLLISEYNGNTQINNDETDDIAVIQATSSGTLMPNGGFYYTSNGASGSGTPSITIANFTSNGSTATINNPSLGNCNGQACALTLDQYYSQIANGYAYFTTTTNPINYNLVGNTTMNLMMDSASGFYVQ